MHFFFYPAVKFHEGKDHPDANPCFPWSHETLSRSIFCAEVKSSWHRSVCSKCTYIFEHIAFHYLPEIPCPLDLSGTRVDYFAWHFNCRPLWPSPTGFHTIHPESVCSCTAGRTLPSLFVSCPAREGSGPSQCSLCPPDGLSVIHSPLSRFWTALEILSVFLSLSVCLSAFIFLSLIFHLPYAKYPWHVSDKCPGCSTTKANLVLCLMHAIARLPCTCLGAERLLNHVFHQDLCVNEKHGKD